MLQTPLPKLLMGMSPYFACSYYLESYSLIFPIAILGVVYYMDKKKRKIEMDKSKLENRKK